MCKPPPSTPFYAKLPTKTRETIRGVISGPPLIILFLDSGTMAQRLRALVAAQTLGIAVGRGVLMIWGPPDEEACRRPFTELFDAPSTALKGDEIVCVLIICAPVPPALSFHLSVAVTFFDVPTPGRTQNIFLPPLRVIEADG